MYELFKAVKVSNTQFKGETESKLESWQFENSQNIAQQSRVSKPDSTGSKAPRHKGGSA